ncbi:MAG: hypothetical protein ACOX6D_03855 [Thermoguttaceae bacterium]|jgi:excinuclease ABC subunit A
MAKKTSSSSDPASKKRRSFTKPVLKPPRRDVVFSDAERKRRTLFESSKKNHCPGEAERNYHGVLPPWSAGWLLIQGARQNNLKAIDVPIPLSAFTVVTGVSGSGKSSLVEEVLCRELSRLLNRTHAPQSAFDRILGAERLDKIIEVDQQPLGQTPTSNPATYTGLFDLIRSLFAKLPESRLRGWNPRRFSFNVPGGRCEKCEGAGHLKIEMHFLADVWITCDACGGKRYDAQTLEVTYRGKSIADVLQMSCGEARDFFADVPQIRRKLQLLCDVGLDYIALGQPATMLSGGEAQRVKLAAELARPDTGKTLYVFDEPTTGLHFEDLRKLLSVLHRLVDLGNTVVVIEHNLDVIKSADWIIDLGPEAGLAGGQLVFAGTPEELADYGRAWAAAPPNKQATMLRSWTADALIPIIEHDPYHERSLYDPAEEAKLRVQETLGFSQTTNTTQNVPMPWETDGRSWHISSRRSRSGFPCRWSGQVLAEVVDKIEDSKLFPGTNWNNRTLVEIPAHQKQFGWFFHAQTGEEWLLKLKFRVPQNAYDKKRLEEELWLKPLNDIPEVPLYGTQSRVRVETVGPWYEVELRVFSYEEFNQPAFWNFLDSAIESFCRYTDTLSQEMTERKMPWKTDGEKWHFSKKNFYGGGDGPAWDTDLLPKMIAAIRKAVPGAREVWTNKVTVPIYRPDFPAILFCQLYTKNSESLILQVNMPKSASPAFTSRILGVETEIDDTDPNYDIYYLRFITDSDFSERTLAMFLAEALRRQPEKDGRSYSGA